MEMFRLPTAARRYSAWERIENYVREERPLHPIRQIVVKGVVDVVFRRSDMPTLIVAGETDAAVASVKTQISNQRLVIERQGVHLNRASFVGMNINVGIGITEGGFHHENVAVGLALPEAPAVTMKGSGHVTMLDLQQAGLDLRIEGSGDITAYGQVVCLQVEIAGSGNLDANELISERARLSIAGAGNIAAFVRTEVLAQVSGAGDIVVRGNPPRRDQRVAGSGNITFR